MKKVSAMKRYKMTGISLYARVFILVIKDWLTPEWKREDSVEYKGVVLYRKELYGFGIFQSVLWEVFFSLKFVAAAKLAERLHSFAVVLILAALPIGFLISAAIVSFILTLRYANRSLR